MSSAADYLARIREKDSAIHAFLFTPETVEEGSDGELAGLSLAIKDNILIKDWQATAASRILEGFIAPYDATVIKKLKKAGATFVGKTNLDEFAMGSSTENSAFGPTKNPWDVTRVPGGTSGGSAAAVAADFCDAALGSDTGGSVRQPAAFCGVVGLKPTYGAVSRYGLIASASSLDTIGVLARSAETVEKIFAHISGKDANDQTTIDYSYQPYQLDFAKLRVGLPKEFWEQSIDSQITEKLNQFVDWLKAKGATVTEVSLPTAPRALSAYYIIQPAEASANVSRYDGIRYQKSVSGKSLLEQYKNTRELFGVEVKRRIILGTFVLSVGHYDAYYESAVRVRRHVEQDYAAVFKQVDVLLSATMPMLPFKLGEKSQDPLAMYQADLFTISGSLAGVPGIALPVGFSSEGLPIGAQLTAAKKSDNILLALAKVYQAETDYHTKKAEGF